MGIFRPTALTSQEVQRIIETKISWIREVSDPLQIWVFGSAAREQMTDASDVDIALIFADEDELQKARKRIHPRPRPDAWPQDLAFFTLQDFESRRTVGGLPKSIVEDGRIVYEREINQ